MTDATRQRLFGIDSAFAHPATGILLAAISVMLLVGLVTILLVSRHLEVEGRRERRNRCYIACNLSMHVGPFFGSAETFYILKPLSACFGSILSGSRSRADNIDSTPISMRTSLPRDLTKYLCYHCSDY